MATARIRKGSIGSSTRTRTPSGGLGSKTNRATSFADKKPSGSIKTRGATERSPQTRANMAAKRTKSAKKIPVAARPSTNGNKGGANRGIARVKQVQARNAARKAIPGAGKRVGTRKRS